MATRKPLVIGSDGLPQQLQAGDTLAGAGGGGGTPFYTGTAIVDFGAGADMASVDITGQTDILSTSYVDASLTITATSDHSADEHIIEELDVFAGNIVVATGFTIYVKSRGSAILGQWSVSWMWS